MSAHPLTQHNEPESARIQPVPVTELRCSVGVMAHNEALNIGALLERLRTERSAVGEILVVAGGCTDATVDIARRAVRLDPRIRVIVEPERRGKAAAVNQFVAQAAEDICILVGADCLPAEGALEKLLSPLRDSAVGMTGARPVPLNDPSRFTGFAVRLLWDLHHDVALRQPKCGEMVAFRKSIGPIPEDTVVDEPALARRAAAGGLRIVYVPDAVVYNMGPETVREILMRRRNITAGYLRLAAAERDSPRAARSQTARAAIRRLLTGNQPRAWTLATFAVEAAARCLGWFDARFSKKQLHVWDMARTTKALPLDKITKHI